MSVMEKMRAFFPAHSEEIPVRSVTVNRAGGEFWHQPGTFYRTVLKNIPIGDGHGGKILFLHDHVDMGEAKG
jgi:hypothetical protein